VILGSLPGLVREGTFLKLYEAVSAMGVLVYMMIAAAFAPRE
jgi:hypothetical protein